MTQLALARKWRPRRFDALVGQDHVVRALTHALATQRLHHAYLFTGTRGVGKTTALKWLLDQVASINKVYLDLGRLDQPPEAGHCQRRGRRPGTPGRRRKPQEKTGADPRRRSAL